MMYLDKIKILTTPWSKYYKHITPISFTLLFLGLCTIGMAQDTCDASGGTLMGGPFSFCVDGEPDNLAEGSIALTGGSATNMQWVVTDDQGMILGLPPSFTVPNFDGAGVGTCFVYNLGYEGELTGLAAGENIGNLDGCFDLSNGIPVVRSGVNGGMLTGGPFSFCVDGQPDNLAEGSIVLTGSSAPNMQWVVTDDQGMILGLPPSFTAPNFDGAGVGTCLVYNLGYEGEITGLAAGENIGNLDGCFDLSNGIAVERTSTGAACMAGMNVAGRFFASSNTMQEVGVFNIQANGSVMANTFRNVAGDADGIHYDEDLDVLYQLNRNNGSINAYSNVNASLMAGANPPLTASSSADSKNGREIAFTGGRIVVAQDANDANGMQNRFYVYDASPTRITLDKVYDVDINLWGIHATGETLFAIEDNSNRLAIYDNFFAPASGVISPTRVVSIDGLVRTHGITYIADRDMMILTDVGAASSPTDGALFVIRNFMTASADGVISASEYVRIAGPMSLLGNPVDVAFDAGNNTVYIAERANGGGRILGFSNPTSSGDAAPTYNQEFAGASAIYFPGESTAAGPMLATSAQLFASSNNQQMIGVYNILENRSVAAMGFSNVAGDADGIYYDAPTDILYQVNRMNGSVNSYTSVNANLSRGMRPQYFMSSSANFSNGRELAESNGRLVVAQDANEGNGMQNQLAIYSAMNGNMTFQRKVDVDINLWGIHADGETLYAIVDNSNQLAVYENFFSNTASSISPDQTISIEGLVRTHGITYIADRDMMLLTDVGAASSATDGALIVVRGFMAASADGMISLSEQVRVEGDNTFLGNPVDIAFDGGTDMVFIAERANGGGRILGYVLPMASGNQTPLYNNLFAGASAVYLSGSGGGMGLIPVEETFKMRVGAIDNTRITPIQPELEIAQISLNTGKIEVEELLVFPNPAADNLTVHLPSISNSTDAVEGFIINNIGQQVQTINLTDTYQTINISKLPAGIYNVVLKKENQHQVAKFVITRNQ